MSSTVSTREHTGSADGTDTSGGAVQQPVQAGPNELGRVSIADQVVQKIAARAVLENPDAGSAATRVLGVALPGAGHLGVHGSDLDALPKTSVQVDGASVFVEVTLSVRWPADIAAVTHDVRQRITDRVSDLAGLTVQEVDISVADLVTDLPTPPRVK